MVGDGIGDEGGDGQSSAESVSGSSGMRGKPVPVRCVTGTAWPERIFAERKRNSMQRLTGCFTAADGC
jgi:hypothetical protein